MSCLNFIAYVFTEKMAQNIHIYLDGWLELKSIHSVYFFVSVVFEDFRVRGHQSSFKCWKSQLFDMVSYRYTM